MSNKSYDSKNEIPYIILMDNGYEYCVTVMYMY